MKDPDIRKAFKEKYLKKLDPNTLVVDELCILNSKSRVDIAVIYDDFIQAFEIKSKVDSTVRLPNQVECYDKVFDSISVIGDEKHLAHFTRQIPSHWGIILVKKGMDLSPEFELLRLPKQNYGITKEALSQLFWRDEALKFLKERGIKKLSKKNKHKLWKLIEEFPIEEIKKAIIFNLKNRKDWRPSLFEDT